MTHTSESFGRERPQEWGMIREALARLVEKIDLSQGEVEGVMEAIMRGDAPPELIAAFLTALRMKGEAVDEIMGAAVIMRREAVKIKAKSEKLLDTCGTGGDSSYTFNISTTAAFIAAGAGAVVAKHGNRAISSKCGSADLLKALGVNIDLAPEQIARCIDEAGIGFMYAPLLHPAMKYATPVRRQLGIRTIFNMLGPLSNPAGAKYQLLGVYDAKLAEPIAHVLKKLGSVHALIVHGSDGLDEITITGPTTAFEVRKGKVRKLVIKPQQFGIKPANLRDLKGEDENLNARIALGILNGEKGPKTDIVLLNAAAAIYAADAAKNMKDGFGMAVESVKSGKALGKLQELKKLSGELK